MSIKLDNYIVLQNNRSNLIACLKDEKEKKNPSNIYFFWPTVERIRFQEYTDAKKNEEPVIRVYGITKDKCEIQFRAYQSLAGKQKAKNLLATGLFCKEDLEFILQQMNALDKK